MEFSDRPLRAPAAFRRPFPARHHRWEGGRHHEAIDTEFASAPGLITTCRAGDRMRPRVHAAHNDPSADFIAVEEIGAATARGPS